MSKAREGTFSATPVEWGVSNSKNGFPQFVCKFRIDGEYTSDNGGGYFDVTDEDMGITGFFNLIYRDKESGEMVRNEITIQQLETVFGWSDRNLQTLNDGEYGGNQVQIVLEDEPYNGKSSIKVKYLNHVDYQGGAVKKADADALKKMSQVFGSLLKAGAPAAAKKPMSSPAAKPPSMAANALEAAKKAAWEKFKGTTEAKGDALADEWRAAIAAYFNGRAATSLGAAEWKQFADDGFARANGCPTSEEVIDPDRIPF